MISARLLGREWRSSAAAALCAAIFAFAVSQMHGAVMRKPTAEMVVALPRFMQVIMAAGDRYLAADIGAIRALVASTQNMDANNFHIQGIVQSDVAWFNPAHEDNYYIAAAILPWNGELPAAQYVLRKAIDGRPFDMWPAFYYAFDIFYFLHDAKTAADWLRVGASHSDSESDRLMTEQLASFWYQRGATPRSAAMMIRAMARNSRQSRFRQYLEKRAQRLDNLAALQDAKARYEIRFGRPPAELQDLVQSAAINGIPADPFGIGYGLDAGGNPVFLESLQRKKP